VANELECLSAYLTKTHPVTMATMLDCLSMYCTENTAIMVTMAVLPTKEGTNEQTKLI